MAERDAAAATTPRATPPPPLWTAPDGRPRCAWAEAEADFLDYHDTEWGFPIADDRELFELLSLEAFQSGLSWRTILAKRDGFRRAFADFDPATVASFGPDDVERLVGDASIVRHRGKIEATIANAARLLELVEREGSFAAYVWRFEPEPDPPGTPVASTSPASIALAKDLKSRGWRFFGPTTAHAFLQAAGLVDDHDVGCAIRPASQRARADFTRPVAPTS